MNCSGHQGEAGLWGQGLRQHPIQQRPQAPGSAPGLGPSDVQHLPELAALSRGAAEACGVDGHGWLRPQQGREAEPPGHGPHCARRAAGLRLGPCFFWTSAFLTAPWLGSWALLPPRHSESCVIPTRPNTPASVSQQAPEWSPICLKGFRGGPHSVLSLCP